MHKVSLAAQRRWMDSEAAATAARDEGRDCLSNLGEEREEQRLYRQVRLVEARALYYSQTV